MHLQLHNLYKKYGPVCKIFVHQQPVVIISSSEAIYEALVHKGKLVNTFIYNNIIQVLI